MFTFTLLGCKTFRPESVMPSIDDYRFEKTVDMPVVLNDIDARLQTIRFEGVPFAQAMSVLTAESGKSIAWSEALDSRTVYGNFSNMALPIILDSIAHRVNANVTVINGAYFLGEMKKEDRLFGVTRIPPSDREALLDTLRQCLSTEGTVGVVGSCLTVCDRMEQVRQILALVESIRERSERSYIAEVYFIRTSEEKFIKLTADLQFNQVDVFSSSFNVEELFRMFVDADAGDGWSRIDQRPVVTLAEGRPFTFTDGSELNREQKSIAENGVMHTTGYAKFSDGLKLTMCLNRVSERSYMVDMDLTISVFDKTDKSEVPGLKKSNVNALGILAQDGKVCFVTSLKTASKTSGLGLLSLDHGDTSDRLTIWLRVRELKRT